MTRKARPKSTEPTAAAVKRATFAVEYLKDFNATQAAIRAGYSAKTAGQAGSRLLKDVEVQRLIKPKREEAAVERAESMSRIELTIDRVKLEIARLAFFDVRRMFDKSGSPIPITDLDDDTAAAIAGLEVVEQYEGVGDARVFTGYLKKWKLADKNSALDKAARILGMFEKDNSQKPDGLTSLIAAMGKSMLPVVKGAPK